MKKSLTLVVCIVISGLTSLLSVVQAKTGQSDKAVGEQPDQQRLTEQQTQEQLKRQIIWLNQQLRLQQQAINQMARKVITQDSAGTPVVQTKPAATAVAVAEPAEEQVERKKTADRARSTEDLLQATHNVFTRRFTIEPSFTYGYYSRKDLILNGFLALNSIFLGNINLDRIRSSTMQMNWKTRYTLNSRWQIELDLPFLYRLSQFDSAGENNNAEEYETKDIDGGKLGDVSAAAYYHVIKESPEWPDFVWNARLRVPTGRDPFGIKVETTESGVLSYPTEIATGAGVWGISTGFSLARTYDPAIVFFNLNYGWNLSEDFDDISAKEGEILPGEIDLGDYVDYSVGLAFAVSERMSIAMSFNQRFYGETERQIDGQPRQEIPRSDTNTANLGFGTTLALTDSLSMVTSVSAGLTEDSPDYQVSLRFPYRF